MENNVWFALLCGGLITFGIRFSLIYLFGKFEIPATLQKALHYVPPAVFICYYFSRIIYSKWRIEFSIHKYSFISRCHCHCHRMV
ncbi:MAG: branched-chain amino acid transport [Chloroflexi bacterium OLB14]|nr:MAG: branched-chain amino acid transport [Chloroflexi bacterium OLB14]